LSDVGAKSSESTPFTCILSVYIIVDDVCSG